jgi:hypothetical protein
MIQSLWQVWFLLWMLHRSLFFCVDEKESQIFSCFAQLPERTPEFSKKIKKNQQASLPHKSKKTGAK